MYQISFDELVQAVEIATTIAENSKNQIDHMQAQLEIQQKTIIQLSKKVRDLEQNIARLDACENENKQLRCDVDEIKIDTRADFHLDANNQDVVEGWKSAIARGYDIEDFQYTGAEIMKKTRDYNERRGARFHI